MIPKLDQPSPLQEAYRAFLAGLAGAGFTGDVHADLGTRLVTATDNSVYQVLPQAVVYPRSTEDVITLMRHGAAFPEVTFVPRGGGTGTNGQALSDGVVVDVSRYMNTILEVSPAEGWARVQPGVVLDQLNDALGPHGVFFAPNLSPSSRATIGGMIATDACGKGSRIHGRTSEHVLALRTVLIDGAVLDTAPLDPGGLDAARAAGGSLGRIYRTVDEVVTENAALIEEQFPRLRRFMTGYNLSRVRRGDVFDLNALLSGAEGTLGVTTEATIRLTPLPTASRLVVLKYRSFGDALGSAELVVRSNPSAIETIDQTVLGLARDNPIWHAVGHIFEGDIGLAAINLVEYEGADPAEVDTRVEALLGDAQQETERENHPFGAHVARDAREAAALWSLRKSGVGLLGNAPGPRKPIPFVEDTVVPPEHLRAYIEELRALLDAHGLYYGMFGHIDVGCLHVRPALDMTRPDDQALLRSISDQVVALVQKYGGQIWGEHGKGMRSEYNPRFFGPRLFRELCGVKAAFDPDNRLNPGKLAVPDGGVEGLVSIEAPTRGELDRQIPLPAREHFDIAVYCNGNGACFDWNPDHVMCPSSKVTRDRIHSPKGRAGLLREWLRRLGEQGVDASEALRQLPGGWEPREDRDRGYDFSHEVYDAMDGCLACKACATSCPIKVDIPRVRSEFFALYYGRYRRPLRDYLVAGLESMAAPMSLAPRLSNALSQSAPARWVLRKVGIVDAPKLSVPTARRRLRERGVRRFSLDRVTSETVVVMPDAFSHWYDAGVVAAVVDVARALGRPVEVLPCRPSGKGHHIKGFLRAFDRIAEANVALLGQVHARGGTLVGIDPAVTLMYRDEVPKAVGPLPFRVHLLQEWLARQTLPKVPAREEYALLSHCTEQTAVPGAPGLWARVFDQAGLSLEVVQVGCCGMCGAYGHEAHHEVESRGIFEMSWRHALNRRDPARVLATGFSCRHQSHRCADLSLRHPVEALAEYLG